MKIKKINHCTLIIEHKGVVIITDPGKFAPNFLEELKAVDVLVITHEHSDHYHASNIETLIKKFPNIIILCNESVGSYLKDDGIESIQFSNSKEYIHRDVTFKAYDAKHEEIFGEIGIVQNTGVMIDEAFFFPGDAFNVPDKHVKVLAFPVAGPWTRMKEVINYANECNAAHCIPVHDALLSESGKELYYSWIDKCLVKTSRFIPLQDGGEVEIGFIS